MMEVSRHSGNLPEAHQYLYTLTRDNRAKLVNFDEV